MNPIIPIFLVLGSLVVLSYAVGVYLMKTFPNEYDVNGIWAGLQYSNKKSLLYLWYLGEMSACGGFLCLTCFLWEEIPGQEVFVAFYTLFLASAFFWMPLAIQGDKYYSLTIFVLFLTSLSTIGLLVESFRFWGPESFKPWLLIPLALHCTFFDLVYWCWTWSPISSSELNKKVACNHSSSVFESRSLLAVTEEENEDECYPRKNSISEISLKYNCC